MFSLQRLFLTILLIIIVEHLGNSKNGANTKMTRNKMILYSLRSHCGKCTPNSLAHTWRIRPPMSGDVWLVTCPNSRPINGRNRAVVSPSVSEMTYERVQRESLARAEHAREESPPYRNLEVGTQPPSPIDKTHSQQYVPNCRSLHFSH